MIEIDGAYGEGGGQILRSSLTLAALTGKPLHIHSIRANRRNPGLRPQHLAAVEAIARLTDAQVSGAALNSSAITLRPTRLRAGRYRFEIPTAGALTLVLQTVFLPLSFTGELTTLTLTGGTHVPWSPIFDYLERHWLPVMLALGFRAEINLKQAGFYPQGGGLVEVKIRPPQKLQPLALLSRGELTQIRGLSGVANLDDSIAKRQKHRALQQLYPLCSDTKIKTLRLPAPGKGTFILLKADFSASCSACFTALGAPGKPAEQVADEAVGQIIKFLETDGCVDPYLADQLLLPLLVVVGDSAFSTSPITPHLLTNAHVIEQFVPGRIKIEGAVDALGRVTVRGGLPGLDPS
jgi:RNA 3'-terminal phosphate cyclase (ATP)